MEQADVRTRRWRLGLVSLCAIALLLWSFEMFQNSKNTWIGTAGLWTLTTDVPFHDVVKAAFPGLPAARAGVKAGDIADLRTASTADRWRFRNGWLADAPYSSVFIRGASQQRITLRPEHRTVDLSSWGWAFGALGALIFAMMIAWRRPRLVEARVLCLFLIVSVIDSVITPNNWRTPWASLDFGVALVEAPIGVLVPALLIAYTLLFGRPVSALRKAIAILAFVVLGFDFLVTLATHVGLWTGAFDLAGGPIGTSALLTFLEPLGFAILAPLAIVTAVAAARGRERSLLIWTMTLPFVSNVAWSGSLTSNLSIWNAVDNIQNTAEFLTPFAIGYALLNRRLLDIGFVINRATSVALISAVAIATFATLEWALGAFFSWLGSGGVLAINILVAVAFGLSAPALYRWITSSVERYLFYRQFAARERVGRLAAGLPFAESADAIAETLTKGVCENLDLPSGAVFRRNQDTAFVLEAAVGWTAGAQLDATDAERLAMTFQGTRSMLRIQDQHLAGPSLPQGDRAPVLAFPLFARQTLIGFALYSSHSSAVALDPDERALLADVAQQASRGYDAVELAARVEQSYEARMEAEAEAKETLRRSNAALERLNEAYGRFVPEEFLRHLNKRSIVDVALGDSVMQRMTVLFSDIRSFMTISEGMSPPEIFKFLNDYLHRVGPLVREHDGFIDKYIGDAIMGLFPGKADDALNAAVALQREIRLFNSQLEKDGKPTIAAGAGIHTGELMLGTIGERGRMETTVIADAVNAASRLETATKTFDCSILLSRETVDALAEPDRFMLRRLGMLQVKGKSEKLEVFECYDGDPIDVVEHKQSTAQTFAYALAALEAGGFAEARERFSPIAAACTADGPAAFYLNRAHA